MFKCLGIALKVFTQSNKSKSRFQLPVMTFSFQLTEFNFENILDRLAIWLLRNQKIRGKTFIRIFSSQFVPHRPSLCQSCDTNITCYLLLDIDLLSHSIFWGRILLDFSFQEFQELVPGLLYYIELNFQSSAVLKN